LPTFPRAVPGKFSLALESGRLPESTIIPASSFTPGTALKDPPAAELKFSLLDSLQ
jgi:hypothetical protein